MEHVAPAPAVTFAYSRRWKHTARVREGGSVKGCYCAPSVYADINRDEGVLKECAR